jgi:hypothetical protein
VGETSISARVQHFLAAHVESVLELEVLLLLRERPERSWTAAELAQDLKIDAAWAGGQLGKLAADKILQRGGENSGQYRYAPASPEMDAVIGEVANAYASHRVTIIGLIFSKPTSTLKTFADAFRIRKEPNDG